MCAVLTTASHYCNDFSMEYEGHGYGKSYYLYASSTLTALPYYAGEPDQIADSIISNLVSALDATTPISPQDSKHYKDTAACAAVCLPSRCKGASSNDKLQSFTQSSGRPAATLPQDTGDCRSTNASARMTKIFPTGRVIA